MPTCGYNEIAGVVCASMYNSSIYSCTLICTVIQLEGGTCSGSAVRKIRNNNGTPNKAYGRFEICKNGQWGRICDGNWGSNDVKVACYELGYTKQSEFHHYAKIYLIFIAEVFTYSNSGAGAGAGFGSYVYGNVYCTSNENTLSSCTLNSPGCSGNNDVAGACFG